MGVNVLPAQAAETPVSLHGSRDGAVGIKCVVCSVDEMTRNSTAEKYGIDLVVVFVKSTAKEIRTTGRGTSIWRRISIQNTVRIVVRVGISGVIVLDIVVVCIGGVVLVEDDMNQHARSCEQRTLR